MKLRLKLWFFLLATSGIINAQVEFRTTRLVLSLSPTGEVERLYDPVTGKEYKADGEKAALLKIRAGKDWENPSEATCQSKTRRIILTYPSSGIKAGIEVAERENHMTFRLVSLNREDKVNAVSWGPFPLSIGRTVGEVVGVVRDGEFAVAAKRQVELFGFFIGLGMYSDSFNAKLSASALHPERNLASICDEYFFKHA